MIPRRLDELRQLFMATHGKALPPEATSSPSAADGAIAEMCKMIWLRSQLGPEERTGWKCGSRIYIRGSKQSHEVLFADGEAMTLFWTSARSIPMARGEY